jgi:AAA domain
MDTATHENPENDPKKVVDYWTWCLRELMLRDPKLTNHQQVKIEHVLGGWLPLDVVSALKTGKSEKSRSDPKSLPNPSGQDDPISVLVAPYMVAAVRDRSRAIEEELLALFWVPGQLMPDGSLQSDLAHLPFLSRALLNPPIGDRKETPPAIASWNEYDSAIRAMGVDWAERWNDRIKHAEEMFRLVAGVGATEWEADGWQRAKHSIVLPWNKESGPAKFILPLCDAWLKEETLPGALQTIASSASHQPCVGAAVKADTMHLGHYGDNALNRKQRDAIRAVRLLKEGQVQAVNGPPGTGKTSLLKTLIADAVVNAAAAGAEPPLILITSTNNTAVKNASRRLAVPDVDGLPVERKRWLPGLRHFAVFEASRKQAEDLKNSADFLLVKSLDTLLFSKDFEHQADDYFLERFKEWCGADKLPPQHVDLVFAKAYLTERLREVIAAIKAKVEFIQKAESSVSQGCVPANIAEVRTRINQIEVDVRAAERKVEDLNKEHGNAVETLGHRSKLHPLWMRWFSFIPRVEALRADLLRQTATTLKFLPCDDASLDSLAKLYNAVDAGFITRKDTATRLAETLQTHRSAWTALESWIVGYVDPNAVDAVDAANRRIDVELRSKAFDLAMRMREAELLLGRGEWEKPWVEAPNTKTGRRGWDTRPKLLKTYACVAPCIVATVYKAAPYCCYYDSGSGRDQPLDLPIDLLIYDEAGQVAPDVGLPLLGLSRRSVAVGDLHQLETIRGFDQASDDRLLRDQAIDKYQQAFLHRAGLTHTCGSVMRAFQQATSYGDTDVEEPGVMLREHFRCVPKIIDYCNELVYRGKLLPTRSDEEEPWIAPMSWAHVRGDAVKHGGTWSNAPEAEAIVRWIADNQEVIRERYSGKDLDETFAIITPYSQQKGLLMKALRSRIGDELANEVTIGTVYSLQGEERPIVVFSPTRTRASIGDGPPAFDVGRNMLNVAVSRAEDAFVVIGDMGLFDEAGGQKPSSVLARHLFADPGNELSGVLPALAVTIPNLVERIDGTEKHRALLVEAFEKSARRLLISSPFLSQSAIEADEVVTLIRAAKKRTVEIDIYTGLKASGDRDGAFLESAISVLIDAGARVWRTNRLHAKTLTFDQVVAVEGSFNWLSAPRNPELARKETSFAVWGSPAQVHAAAIEEEFKALDAVLQHR